MTRGWRDGGPTRWWQWPWRGVVTWWNFHRLLDAERSWMRTFEPWRYYQHLWL